MKVGGIAKMSVAVTLAILFLAAAGRSGGRSAAGSLRARGGSNPHCSEIGGTVTTNFGAIDQNTTMGTATGDLKGAVSGTILGQPQRVGNTVVFQVQHHWVTESGDTLNFEPATATTIPLSATLFAIVTYPVHLTGGTGKFAGASGDITNIGEVDLVKGTVFRYSGQVCFGEQD